MKTLLNNSFLVKIYLLVFVNIFCKTILIAQVQAFITGEVKDSSGTPVENVAVSLKANSGKPFAYSFSGANGKFQINTFLPDTGRYNLEFRNIGYSTNSIAISVLSNKKFTWDQVVIMQRNFKALPDIIIKSDPGVVIKKDTIEYLAKNFKTNETRKVEDLLKNISGFSITPDGKISYRGKIISALLINGDDLVQDQYSLLTKNLSADIVDKIQVIENYNKNRLVGSILKSGEVAINLKLDKKINGKLSGSVSISYSDKKRGEFDGSLIYIKSKFKYIQIQNTNSVAKNVIGQNMFEPNTINNSEIPLDQKKTYYHSPISTSDIYSLDLPKEYILNNKSWLTAPVLFFNLSKSIKLGINLICSNTKATNTSTDISLLQVNNTISWTTLNQQQIERKKSGLSASINLSHDNNKKFAGNFLFQFNHLSRQSNYSDLTSIAIADTLLENFTSTFKIFNVGYNGAIKIARNKLLNFNVSYNDIPENSRISYDTKRFAQYWNFNENYYNLYQQTILRTSYKSAELALLTKLNKHSIKASIRFQEERLYGDDKVWLPRLSAYFINPASKLLVSRNYFSKVIYVRDFNTKISFDFSSDIGLGSFKNFGVTNNFRNKIIWEVNANFRKKIVPNTNLSFSASSIRQLPKLYLFYCDSILSANVSIYQSTKEFSLIRSDALNFSYTINRYKTNAYLSFNSWVKKNYSNYISNSFFNPLVIENAYTPIKNSINTGLGLSAKSYLFPLKSIASFSMNYQIEKGEKIINNILSNAVDKNGAGNFGLATSFKIPINFEVIYNFFLYKGALKNANTDLYASNYFYNITNKIRFQANKKYFTGIQLTYWKLSEKDNILSDFFGSYIISKTKSLDLKIHNIFNCKTFDRKNISANSTNYNQFALVPRYFLLRFTIIF